MSITYRETPVVTLEDHMGSDISIVNAARVSFKKRSASELRCTTCHRTNAEMMAHGEDVSHIHDMHYVLKAADIGLIGYLMRNRHGTPFEMVQFRFRISAPIRVMREHQRHRIGSFNEESTRYVEMEPEFFVPAASAVRVQEGKPGHYLMTSAPPALADDVRRLMREAYVHAWTYYQHLVQSGVAKEIAAYVLPVGTYSEQIWSVNLRSLFNFLSLRNHDSALREIRDVAESVEALAREVCPVAFAAFDANNRVAP